MTTIIIESNNVQARHFVDYARTLPFAKVVEEKRKSFEEVAMDCNAVSLDVFFDELNSRIEKWDEHA
jgi:hypothetical protein